MTIVDQLEEAVALIGKDQRDGVLATRNGLVRLLSIHGDDAAPRAQEVMSDTPAP